MMTCHILYSPPLEKQGGMPLTIPTQKLCFMNGMGLKLHGWVIAFPLISLRWIMTG